MQKKKEWAFASGYNIAAMIPFSHLGMEPDDDVDTADGKFMIDHPSWFFDFDRDAVGPKTACGGKKRGNDCKGSKEDL